MARENSLRGQEDETCVVWGDTREDNWVPECNSVARIDPLLITGWR